MSKPVSVRFTDDLAVRLRHRSARTGESSSSLARRLVDEGMRMDEHPGIMFRDGPSGSRAGLVGGPDVWEVIGVLNDVGGDGPAAVARRAGKWLGLTEAQVRTVEGYYRTYAEEIDDRIADNIAAADEAQRAPADGDPLQP